MMRPVPFFVVNILYVNDNWHAACLVASKLLGMCNNLDATKKAACVGTCMKHIKNFFTNKMTDYKLLFEC